MPAIRPEARAVADSHGIQYPPAMGNDPGQFSRRETHLGIRVLKGLNVCFARIFHDVVVRTPCRLPKQGPAILVCNHLNAIDPVMIQSASPRLIRWMMATEYYDLKALRWIFDTVGVIPVDRNGRDMAAMRAAFRALEAGYILGVFPEGKIETSPELLPFQSGIVLLAGKSAAPVYPAYLDGTQRGKEMIYACLQRNRATLTFGEPFKVDRADTARERIDAAAARVQAAVEKLRRLEVERRRTDARP